LVVRPLRSFVKHFDHETVLPCLAQEEASKPTPLAAPVSTAPAISTTPKTPVAVPVQTPTPAFKKKSTRTTLVISLNPLKVVPSLKPSLKPKEIIDLGTISLGSYRLPPPSPLEPLSSMPSSSESPLSPPPIVRHMTPAQLHH
jgi:hypothetical protein